MENNYLGKGIEYNHTLTADKHYFGGFLNLAENNIEAVFSLFCQRFGIKTTKAVKIIDTYFNDDVAISEYQNKIDFLKQYFPVIHYLDLELTDDQFQQYSGNDIENKRRAYFRENFIALIKSIQSLRNFYTHHYHKPTYLDDKVFQLLDNLFSVVISDVKKRKMKGDQTRHLLKKSLKEEIKILIEAKTSFLKEQKKEGKRVTLRDEDIENGVLNDAFYHLLYKDGVNKNYQSKLISEDNIENKINISESGLLFLLGIFLHRKESEQLRSNIKGYKAKVIFDPSKPTDKKNNSLKFMATHWVFNYLALRPIKHRLNTTFQKETLLIQMADELSKVPDALYQTFTEKQKEEFVEDINEYLKEDDLSESLENSLVVHPVIRKRYEDKFNYFALRFLDEFVDFPSLRFQVYLGNYVKDRREKTISEIGYKTERVIKEKINVFGKLSELSEIKSDYFRSLDSEDTQWEMFPNPSYNLVGNNIPIYIDLAKSKVKGAAKLNGLLIQLRKKQEVENDKEIKPSKTDIISKIDSEIIFGKPTALLSLNELQALLYEVLVNNKTGEEIETILIQKLIERYQTINNFNPDESLPTSQITKKLRKSTNEEYIDIDKILRAIENEIHITNEKLNLIETNRNEFYNRKNLKKKRNFIFTNRELGQQATWLADNIKRFMPKEVKENWKGYQHSQLQQSLAFYETKPKEAYDFLGAYWNFKDDAYPFNSWLNQSFKERCFDEFFENYLNSRKKYFENLQTQITGLKSNKKILNKLFRQEYVWSVFYKRLYVIPSIEIQKEQLLLKPLVFPRGIFDEKPTYIKGKNIEADADLFAEWYRFIQDENKNLQKFYTWKRDYKELFDEHKHTAEFTNNKYGLSESEKFSLFKRKWDNKIKKVIGQDLFINEMIKRIIKEMYKQDIDLSLSDFYLTQEERIEKQNKAKKQGHREKKDETKNIIKDDFIWSMTVLYETEYIKEPAIKLKDIGKFARFLEDEKVIRIFEYSGSKKKWEKEEIEKELESYEKIRREEIFKLFQKIEEKILKDKNFDGVNHPEEFMIEDNPNFKKYITQGVLSKYSTLLKEDINWLESLNKRNFESDETFNIFLDKPKKIQEAFLLIYFRNVFAHNRLPTKKYYDRIKNGLDSECTVSENILRYLNNINL